MLYLEIMRAIKGAELECIDNNDGNICPPVPLNSATSLAAAYQSLLVAHREVVSSKDNYVDHKDTKFLQSKPQIRMITRAGTAGIKVSEFYTNRVIAMKKVQSSRYRGLKFNYGGYIPSEMKEKRKSIGFEMDDYRRFLRQNNTDFVRELLVSKDPVLTAGEKRKIAKDLLRKAKMLERQRKRGQRERERAEERRRMLQFSPTMWNPGVLTLLSQFQGSPLRDEDLLSSKSGDLADEEDGSVNWEADVDYVDDFERSTAENRDFGSGSIGAIWPSDLSEAAPPAHINTEENGRSSPRSSKAGSREASANTEHPDAGFGSHLQDAHSAPSSASAITGNAGDWILPTSASTEWSAPGTEIDDKMREEAYQLNLSRLDEHFAESDVLSRSSSVNSSSRPSTADRQSALPFASGAEKVLVEVWDILETPQKQKVDMAIKYGSQHFPGNINKALKLWVALSEIIPKREGILDELRNFEMEASDPVRFFMSGDAGSTSARDRESLKRERIQRDLRGITRECEELCDVVLKRYGDVVTFRGEPYAEKVHRDYPRLLFELESSRRARRQMTKGDNNSSKSATTDHFLVL
ncbi:hypothetical protein M427DRAFT_330614 [Gonapodya prolifera JEL478]|uniref:Uncharacterized protein n=1 Tax=Gonapodya prolifera (strain JEL478) TaxID=1344416 RepID=A0A139AEP3_GONPJ|nr:hypothetical protein M427DRAFT_330614 [Gonapodya prolifera JEL478]|eukprot:KXS15139.1 hypothetical protein M427DRAFT_330614 [Gonapodya prolifera JEL478]